MVFDFPVMADYATLFDETGDIAGAVRKRMETGLTWYSGDDGDRKSVV